MSEGRAAVAGVGADAMVKIADKDTCVIALAFHKDVLAISYAANVTDVEILAVIERFRTLLQEKSRL